MFKSIWVCRSFISNFYINRFINLVKILLKNQESCIMAAILLIILNFKKAQDKATQYLLTYLF